MRVLIIGGTGLISTAISRYLLQRGDDLTLYNRGQSEARFPDGAKRIVGDRKDFPAFEAQMAEAGNWDCVIDMICYDPAEAESDVRAFCGRTAQLILTSTVDVYNKYPRRYPITEDEAYGAVNTYGINKVRSEEIIATAGRRGDFASTIIRPAHSYGEGGRIINSLGWGTGYVDRIRKGKPIVVHGDGTSLWCACHVDDVGRAYVNALGNAKAMNQVYHVTGEEWMTWNRYHQGVAEALRAPLPRLVHIPTDLLAMVAKRGHICIENFQFDNIFDNTRARADLGFRYTIPWVEGVRRTVAWLDAHNKVDNSDDDPYEDRLVAAWERLGAGMLRELAGLDD